MIGYYKMTEIGTIGKIMKALDIAKKAEVGINFTYFEALELRGYIKSLEEELGLMQEESVQELTQWKQVAKILSEELTATREENSNICWEDVDESSYAQILYKQLLEKF